MLFWKLAIGLLFSFLVAPSKATVTRELNVTTTTATLRGTKDPVSSHQRQLVDGVTCVGDTLYAGQQLGPNESICISMSNGERIHFGLFTSPMPDHSDYTMYRPEIKSATTTYRRLSAANR